MNKSDITSLNNLSHEINEWASANFNDHVPRLGILEEIGEIAHCVLKRVQKIRGFEDFNFFIGELKDGIGDTMIYLLHDLSLTSDLLQWSTLFDHEEDIQRECDLDTLQTTLGNLAEAAGLHLQGLPVAGIPARECIIDGLNIICKCYGLDLMEIVNETWAKVSKRDWKKSPKTGMSESEMIERNTI